MINQTDTWVYGSREQTIQNYTMTAGIKGKMSKYMQYNSGKGKQANISTQLTSGIMEKAKIHKHWGTGKG